MTTRGCNTTYKSKENAYELTMGNSHTLTLCPPAGIVDTQVINFQLFSGGCFRASPVQFSLFVTLSGCGFHMKQS
jgi:hypothetical protein